MAGEKYTRESLKAKTPMDLRKVAKTLGVNAAGMGNEDVIRAILKVQSGGSTAADPGKKTTPAAAAQVAKKGPTPAAAPAKKAPPPPVVEDDAEEEKEEEEETPAPVAKKGPATPAKSAPAVKTPPPAAAKTEALPGATMAKAIADLEKRVSALESAIESGAGAAAEAEDRPLSSKDDILKLSFTELRTACKDNGLKFSPKDKTEALQKILLAALEEYEESAESAEEGEEPAEEEGAEEESEEGAEEEEPEEIEFLLPQDQLLPIDEFETDLKIRLYDPTNEDLGNKIYDGTITGVDNVDPDNIDESLVEVMFNMSGEAFTIEVSPLAIYKVEVAKKPIARKPGLVKKG